MKAANIVSGYASGMPPASFPSMTSVKSVTSDKFPLEHQVEEIDFKGVYEQWLLDKSPNKGTETDFLARKLADGWRVNDGGNGIWRPVNNLGLGTTNQPATAVNPVDQSFLDNAIRMGRDQHLKIEREAAPNDAPAPESKPSARPASEEVANREKPVVDEKHSASTSKRF